jgi:RNA polymerase sigma factor (TIGR02999 family)
MDDCKDVTTILRQASDGDPHSVEELFDILYRELHQIAGAARLRWDGNETLNTTALVHETYLKLVKQDEVGWDGRSHFFAVSAKAMRHILINYAERQAAAKRGGGAPHAPADAIELVAPEAAEELLELEEALERLSEVHERSGRVVELRFFGGFSVRETADALSVSPATVERDWVFASAWLRRELGGPALGG